MVPFKAGTVSGGFQVLIMGLPADSRTLFLRTALALNNCDLEVLSEQPRTSAISLWEYSSKT